MSRQGILESFALRAIHWSGSSWAFAVAVGTIIVWGLTGPIFKFSDTWQLVINTGTTIVTFLMVFLIQNTQNRDTAAIQIKLDELICATEGAHNALLDLEETEDRDLERIRRDYEALATESREELRHGASDAHVREVKPGAGERRKPADSEAKK